MTQLCDEFRNASDYIFKWYQAKPNVKEESFTDWMLFNLSQKLSNFNYREYTRHEENQVSGADFDLWLIEASQFFRMRVQAKKLKRKGNHYEALTYPGRTQSQINLLINSSNPPTKPFYLFYNNHDYNSKCNRHLSGTLITDASQIKSNFLTKKKMRIGRQDLLRISVPLECLFCCPLSEHLDNRLIGIKEFMTAYFPAYDTERAGVLGQSIPDFVKDVLNKELNDGQWNEKHGQAKDNSVKYIVVIDLSKIE